jgi:hypothetical protein
VVEGVTVGSGLTRLAQSNPPALIVVAFGATGVSMGLYFYNKPIAIACYFVAVVLVSAWDMYYRMGETTAIGALGAAITALLIAAITSMSTDELVGMYPQVKFGSRNTLPGSALSVLYPCFFHVGRILAVVGFPAGVAYGVMNRFRRG